MNARQYETLLVWAKDDLLLYVLFFHKVVTTSPRKLALFDKSQMMSWRGHHSSDESLQDAFCERADVVSLASRSPKVSTNDNVYSI